MPLKNSSMKIPSASPASSIRLASRKKSDGKVMKAKPAELIISLAVVVLGVAVAVGTTRLSGGRGYARIGPNAAPAVVAGGLIVLGLWLLYEALSGGWRNAISDSAEVRGEHGFLTSAFIWVSV